MMPSALVFADQLHIDWLNVPPVRAEVAAAVLELLQVFDGVGPSGGGHDPHSKREGHLNTIRRSVAVKETCRDENFGIF